MGYTSCLADVDVWMSSAAKPTGKQYYEYILVYVDDVLVVSHDPQAIMNELSRQYTLKEGSVRPPSKYLGSNIALYDVPPPDGNFMQGTRCWAMSVATYIKQTVADVQHTLNKVGQRLKTRVAMPMSDGYCPELDASPELDDWRANYFQGLIGTLRRIVSLGSIDIMVYVVLISRLLAALREGYLEQAFHIFTYLNCHEQSRLELDGSMPSVDESRFRTMDWSQYYPDAAKAVAPTAPLPRGLSVLLLAFCDADHAGC
jgi:hypothetical protein